MDAYRPLKTSLALAVAVVALPACGPRVIIATGTTIGLKATPGDGNTRPPQVTFGYKRAELALVPTKSRLATSKSDAFSTLAAIHFTSLWFGKTEIRSVVGTGLAAREIQGRADQERKIRAESGTLATPDVQPLGEVGFWPSFNRTVGVVDPTPSKGQDPQ